MDDRTEKRELKGFYRNAKISIRALDMMILGSIALIILVLALDMRNPGFTISFDSKGGTDVPSQNQMYGELLEMPAPPTREGYVFAGWFKDPVCDDPWIPDADIIQSDLTLYGGWDKKP